MIYFSKLWKVALGMFANPDDRRFVIGVLIAFLPAVVIGLIAGKYIKYCCSIPGSCASR